MSDKQNFTTQCELIGEFVADASNGADVTPSRVATGLTTMVAEFVADASIRLASSSISTTLLGKLQSKDPLEEDRQRFVDLFSPVLMHFAKNKLRLQQADAENVLQDVFIKLIVDEPRKEEFPACEDRRKRGLINKYDARRGRFRSWLWKIYENCAKNYLRKHGREQQLLDDVERMFAENAESGADDYRLRLIETAIQILRKKNPVAVEVFLQIKRDGRSYDEVARRSGKTKRAVYQNTYRTRSQILDILHGLTD